ncbi:hypothetical protein L917_20644 [Phytophthora nicotianae]|uniref:Uncharacterized protein n=2 Tax=Phytophthora nicotianae TaxID=4792 RepID=W2QS30_PHYN3|nr:hypothetical protein PPTG_21849 [Phytophthora nicotianae INRA-310]ETL78569.1 hypothetical protein L917_20644 [Phytophthora nicotianae]ETN16007.1 hypothetical protein PPTG_21849 [Phytophthora nicotianae INRA-310]
MRCRGCNKAGQRCGTRYGLNAEGYCGRHNPNAVKCKGIAKSSGQRCKNVEGLNPRGFCDFHKNQDPNPFYVDAPYANQCPGIASSTGVRCRKNWEILPNGYCIYHQSQAPSLKPPCSQVSHEFMERVRAGWIRQDKRRRARRYFR